jgi:hypothetical protein
MGNACTLVDSHLLHQATEFQASVLALPPALLCSQPFATGGTLASFGSTVAAIPGKERRVGSTQLMREGQNLFLELHGRRGDVFVIDAGAQLGSFPVGPLPASGLLRVQIAVDASFVVPPAQGKTLVFQAAVYAGGAQVALTNPSVSVVLDSSVP